MRILAFNFYFPPHGGPGALRPLKLLKYGAELGLEGIVIAAAEMDYPIIDESLLSEIPDSFEILRTMENLDPLRFLRRKKQGVIHAPRSDYFFLPDNKIWWIHPALKLGLLAEPKPDVVWATCPPYSAAIAASRAAKKLGAPFALDFRDSWTKNPNRPELPPIHRIINRRKAKKAVSMAGLITCVYHSICDEMAELAPDAKIALLPNGYDPEDFPAKIPEFSTDDPLRIFYLGTIYPDLNYPLPVLEAIEQESNVNLTIAGRYPERLMRDIERLGIRERVELKGYLPRREALALAANCDIMLIYIDNRPLNLGQITSKTYEYLGLGKPILACVPPLGEAAKLLKNFPIAFIIPPGNTEQTTNTIAKLLKLKQSGNLPDIEPPEKYQRKTQSRRWVELLLELVAK